MDDNERQPDADAPDATGSPVSGSHDDGAPPVYEESLTEELGALIDDGRTYFEAEVAFQKTRAKLAGKSIGIAIACALVALILLNIAFLALAVGLVIALAPIMTIWGAIAVVVGSLFVLVALLGWIAMRRGQLIAAIFAAPKDADSKEGGA